MHAAVGVQPSQLRNSRVGASDSQYYVNTCMLSTTA